MVMLNNAYLSINGSDVSAYLQNVDVPIDVTMLDGTVMGATSTATVNEAGLRNWSITANFKETSAAAVDAILGPLVGAAAFAIIVKPRGATTAATNPKWTGNAVLQNYNPISGRVGDLHSIPVTLQSAGALTRAVAD